MNIRMIGYTTGVVLLCMAGLMILPLITSLVYNGDDTSAFLASIAITAAVGFLLGLMKPKNTRIFAREGFLTVALSWIMLSLFGALPFVLSGAIPNYVDAMFESMSGFTTTGASILTDIESLDKGILFWRSFTHWIGGMGVLVFILAILPLSGGRNMHVMRAEVPGPTVSKLLPKMRTTAIVLYAIYMVLTMLEIVLLLFAGMPLFDSMVHSFGTAGTGGFSIKNASIAAYDNPSVEIIITVFMLLFGINFNIYYLILIRQFSKAFFDEELKTYTAIVLTSIVLVSINIYSLYGDLFTTVRNAAFQVATIITTTGYATANFDEWPEFSKSLLVLLMFVGASAGSTGGGLKVSRFIIMVKSVVSGLKTQLFPSSVNIVRLQDRRVEESTVREVHSYFILYMLIMLGSFLIISLDGFSFETSFTAVVACLNNIGPGLDMVGPIGNYSEFSPLSKIVLFLNMVIGRLEILPIIIMFTPSAWRGRWLSGENA